MRIGQLSIRFGKAPQPAPNARDTLSRLARAYGVRRDVLDISETISQHIEPPDRQNIDVIIQIVAAMIVPFPETLDQLLAAGYPSDEYRNYAIDAAGDISSPGGLLDAVLADIRRVALACESK